MLSAKLYEDKLIIIDSETLQYPKTQLLEAILAPYGIDKLLFLVPNESENKNFELAARNLQNVQVKKAQEFNISEMLRNDYVFLTTQGMQELEAILESRQANYFRNRKVSSET